MTTVWRGIDPNQAESMLRSVNRRLSELDSVLQEQQSILRANPGSFAFQLSCESLLQMQEHLRVERQQLIQHRAAERLDVALEGRTFRNNAAHIGTLGVLLLRLQKLYSSLAQAIGRGPTLRGPISREILRGTELQLSSTFPSSFGMSMFVETSPDLIGDNIASSSLEALFTLLRSTESDRQVMQVSGEFGGRALNHLRHIVSILNAGEANLRLEWSDYAGLRHYWATERDTTELILKRLEAINETKSETK